MTSCNERDDLSFLLQQVLPLELCSSVIGAASTCSNLKRIPFCRDHEEDFFGIERCLRCIDKGMRGQVLSNLRRVNKDGVPAGTWVYQPVYPRVLDKLNELLGHFQNDNIRMIKKRQSSVTSSSSSGSNK